MRCMQLIAKHVLLIVILTFPFSAQSALAGKQDVSALRSAYLFYFSHFIEWPTPYVFENQTFNLCVLSNSEKDLYQLSTLEGKQTGSNQLHIVDISKANAAGVDVASKKILCHMFYLAEGMGYPSDARGVVDYTLIITEGDDVQKRGDIHLYSKESKLKFEINKPLLDDKKFNVSSKLMRLSQKEGK